MKTEKEGNIFEMINCKQKICSLLSKVLKKCMFLKVLFNRKEIIPHLCLKKNKKN